jgi:NAD kinase
LRLGIFVHSKRPKVSVKEIIKVFDSVNLSYSEKDPDIAVVVGGDGTFGYYGRTLRIPMLFVGVNDPDILGSKAKLAGVSFDDLSKALMCIKLGRYFVDKRKMFSLTCGTKKLVDILTDVYLERGAYSHGIRYALSVFSTNKFKQSSRQIFTEYAIGNGVIISTSFGSGGYYSYPQRRKLDRYNDNDTSIQKRFSDNKIGICHIIPTFLLRLGNETEGKKYNNDNTKVSDQIQYTVPIESNIKINLIRDADVRLYGISDDSKGTAIGIKTEISISRSNRIAKIIQLHR